MQCIFQEFQGEEQKFDGTRAVDVSEHAEKVHVVNTGSVVLRFKASNNAGGDFAWNERSEDRPATGSWKRERLYFIFSSKMTESSVWRISILQQSI